MALAPLLPPFPEQPFGTGLVVAVPGHARHDPEDEPAGNAERLGRDVEHPVDPLPGVPGDAQVGPVLQVEPGVDVRRRADHQVHGPVGEGESEGIGTGDHHSVPSGGRSSRRIVVESVPVRSYDTVPNSHHLGPSPTSNRAATRASRHDFQKQSGSHRL
jgi:hypothetical protein